MDKNRAFWIDAAKGLAMLIIMWGHVQESSPLKNWLTSFHVPLYLVLTGVLYARRGYVMGGGKILINKLLRPYITFSLIAIICYLFWGLFTHSDWILTTERNLYKTITGYGIMAIWFIPSYFIACYIFFKTFRFNSWLQCLFLITEAVIGIIASSLFTYWKTNLTPLYYELIYYPLAALFRGVACAFFITSGKLMYDLLSSIKTKKETNKRILIGVFGVVSLALNLFLCKYNERTNFSLMRLGDFPYMVFINGILGSIWAIVLFYLLRNICSFKFLQFVGRKSLIIMGTHMSLLLTTIVPLAIVHLIGKPPIQTVGYYLYGVLCVAVMILIELPIIRLFDGKLKFLVSKTK